MDKNEFILKMNIELEKINIKVEEEKIDNFYNYMETLLEWNKMMNLTNITNPDEIILKHFVDSLTILKYVDGKSIIDIGTGAGFPRYSTKDL